MKAENNKIKQNFDKEDEVLGVADVQRLRTMGKESKKITLEYRIKTTDAIYSITKYDDGTCEIKEM